MKITRGRLYGLIVLLVFAAFALGGCAAVGTMGEGAGKVGGSNPFKGLFKKSPDAMTPEEREAYVQGRDILSYTGASLDEISKIVDEVIRTNQEALHIKEWRALPSVKLIALDPGAHDGEMVLRVDINTHSWAPKEVFLKVWSGNEGYLSSQGVAARRLTVLIDRALRERKLALVG